MQTRSTEIVGEWGRKERLNRWGLTDGLVVELVRSACPRGGGAAGQIHCAFDAVRQPRS